MTGITIPPKPSKPGKRKADRLELRIDPDLLAEAKEYAEKHNVSLATAVRALLIFWLDEDHLDADDLAAGESRAPRR